MRLLPRLLLTLIFLTPLAALGTDVEGDVWGTWTKENSPYNVIGEVRVPPESTLVIESGVVVDFQGHYKFTVDSSATLLAVGTETDSIYFTTEDTATGWHGIRFMSASSNSQVSHCRIEYGRATGELPDNCGGGIFCYGSGITISHNRIAMNSAEGDGGGIFAELCSGMTIGDNLIIENSAETGHGGGIFCEHCDDLAVINNTISDNSAFRGGAIQCVRNINVTVRDNTVNGNSSYASGSGIRCQKASGLISGNLVFGNWTLGASGGNGAGIYTRNCGRDLVVSHNVVRGNVAAGRGGGIYCRNARTYIIDNTISGNSATLGGGIACREYAHPILVNTILWSDSSEAGPEICLLNENSDPCTLTVAYCDVDGGQSGVRVDPGCVLSWAEGNIDADPIFVGPYNQDFYLRWHSPCIDVGDPSLTDPDGTRSDMGALYFNQDVAGIVEVYPHDTPIVIPPQGGDIVYDGWVFNFFGHARRVDIWTYAFVPEMGRYGPLRLYENVRIPADSLGRNEVTQHIPGYAPEGDYVFVAYVGEHPSTIIDSSCFYFTKTGSIAGGIADWQSLKGWFDEDLASTGSGLPTDYGLGQNYPNPFNATTLINYQLASASYVKLEVYNLIGRKVATLVNGKQGAGSRSVVWDAANVSSGLYLYKLTAGDFSETKRTILVK